MTNVQHQEIIEATDGGIVVANVLCFPGIFIVKFDRTRFSPRLIPVPMVGFKELLCRLQIQEQMTKQHQTRVDVSVFALV